MLFNFYIYIVRQYNLLARINLRKVACSGRWSTGHT